MAAEETSLDAEPADTARYIEQMTGELARLAARSNLGFLAFLLRMAETDAKSEARKLARPDKS